MGSRSRHDDGVYTYGRWSRSVRNRADREHRRKRLAEQQRRHLLRIKTDAQLRDMRYKGRAG